MEFKKPENISEIFSEVVNGMPAMHYTEKGKSSYVVISFHNAKVGSCISVSLNNDFCNPEWPCYPYCYARKLTEKRDSVRASYDNNTHVFLTDPDFFFRAVGFGLQLAEMYHVPFRFHVDGELKDLAHFSGYMEEVKKHPGAAALLMTKRYDIVNQYFDMHGIETRPDNFYVRFSTNDEMDCCNPYGFPVSHVAGCNGTAGLVHCLNQAAKKAKSGKWTCFDCALHGFGCFGNKGIYFVKE